MYAFIFEIYQHYDSNGNKKTKSSSEVSLSERNKHLTSTVIASRQAKDRGPNLTLVSYPAQHHLPPKTRHRAIKRATNANAFLEISHRTVDAII